MKRKLALVCRRFYVESAGVFARNDEEPDFLRLVGGETLSVTQMSNDPERLTEFLMEHYGSG